MGSRGKARGDSLQDRFGDGHERKLALEQDRSPWGTCGFGVGAILNPSTGIDERFRSGMAAGRRELGSPSRAGGRILSESPRRAPWPIGKRLIHSSRRCTAREFEPGDEPLAIDVGPSAHEPRGHLPPAGPAHPRAGGQSRRLHRRGPVWPRRPGDRAGLGAPLAPGPVGHCPRVGRPHSARLSGGTGKPSAEVTRPPLVSQVP